jgi:hypothetical protein
MVYNQVMSEMKSVVRFPSFRTFFWASLLLCLFGWGGLAILVANTLPTMGPRWLFYFLFMSGVSGLALPVTFFINRRFLSNPPADESVIVREAIWIGFYACLALWLKGGEVLNLVLALALALGFAIVEVLLRVREISLWKPKESNE